MRAIEFITEVFQPGKTNWKWRRQSSDEAFASFIVADREYQWHAFTSEANLTKWEIQFRLMRVPTDPDGLDLFGTTGTGNSAEVLSTAVDITREFIKQYGLDKVEEITFNAKEDSRIGLYAKMINRLLPDWDLYQKYSKDKGMEYHLTDRRAYDKPENKTTEGQGVAEGVDDSTNLSGLQAVQSGRTALGLVNLPVVPSNNNLNTTAKVVNTGSRIVAVYKVQGVNIPFYISTGDGGKASVPPGKWYPVFGIHSSGWLNKGTEESINKFYGSKALARGAEILNKYLGDLRSVEDKIPLMKPDGYSIINKDLKPMGWHEVDSNVNEFKKRINAVLVQIGDTPHYPEVEYSKNDKKSQIVHLQNLAKFYPNITMKDFVNQGKEKIINDAMLEVNQLKNYYGQHKQADFVQLLSNLENDINSFKRGSPANTNNQNSVPTLGLLLKGTLGKINFATP